ncbi:hypothetical protein GJ744_003051 [Endocarpon pusillum]|uniref:Pentatricopeptide repeat protein n=1 Tax=Endocarpon pusillum TaxID=364733 RepID=A0A8H7AAB4_9EURO|nr:hypothetical protein GJ744_003051 [Endocarpon pusillum]
MRRICEHSRRWHQQFFPSALHLGHRPCFPRLWLPAQAHHRQYAKKPNGAIVQRPYARRPKGDTVQPQSPPEPNDDVLRGPHAQKADDEVVQHPLANQQNNKQNNDVVVHEFEQIGTNKKSRVAVNPKEELEVTGEYLRSQLESLEKELAVLREGPFGPNSEFMQSLPPKERKMALKALGKDWTGGLHDPDDFNPEELDRLIEAQDSEADNFGGDPPPQVTLQYTDEHQAYVRNFNSFLEEAVNTPVVNANTKISLWRSYRRCCYNIQNFPSTVPPQVWDVLWRTQTDLSHRHGIKKVLRLAKDMLSQSATPLSPQQILVYLECLRLEKYLETAIQCWNENRSSLGRNAQVAKQFWALGVQLYSDNDQPGEAESIALQCLEGSLADTGILVPVIDSWARNGTANCLEKAWASYLHVSKQSGTEVNLEDYEKISATLLKHGHSNMALAVFKDTALRRINRSEYDSFHTFQRLASKIGEIQSSAINAHEVSRVSLNALTVLPRFLQNKFFFAFWIKGLLGHGQVDEAAKVVELMYERGVKPDAKHLNGIVGAWLRDGSDEARNRAEQMAWSMINARIDFVRNRAMNVKNRDVVSCANRPIPPATIETFSILLLHYTRRCQFDLAENVTKMMTEEALIAPNVYIWNHWLYAALRAKNLEKVWALYLNMQRHVQPDLETFACLWDSAKLQWDRSRSAQYEDFPTARRLFKGMATWMPQLPEAQLIRTKQEFSRDLHNQIIRVFCLSQDLPGTLCALHGLVQLFKEYPDSDTTRIIVIQLAHLLPPDSLSVGVRRKSSTMKTALSAVNNILQIVTEQRAITLKAKGLDPDRLDETTQKQFQLDFLSDLLVVFLKRLTKEKTPSLVNRMQHVAAHMGVNIDAVNFRVEE